MLEVNLNTEIASRALGVAMRDLEDALKPYQVRRALIPAARLIRNDAQRRAPYGLTRQYSKYRDKPHLRDSIFMKAKLPRRLSNLTEVMVAAGYRRAPHAHLVEYGTGPRYTKSGRYCGIMPAIPFFRPAIDHNREAAAALIDKYMWRLVERTWAKGNVPQVVGVLRF